MMRIRQHPRPRDCRGGIGFTVVELLVAVSVMTVIVLTLYAVFDQTQRAMRSNASQVDVLEGVRAVNEVLGREIAQMDAANVPSNINFHLRRTAPPILQQMPGTNAFRMNYLQEFFFLSRNNKDWQQTAFLVSPMIAYDPFTERYYTLPFGTLYRVQSACPGYQLTPGYLSDPYFAERAKLAASVPPGDPAYALTNLVFQRLLDGVVHFRVEPLDALGRPMSYQSTNVYGTNFVNYGYDTIMVADPTTNAWDQAVGRAVTEYAFLNQALPAYIELEIAVLEPSLMAQLLTLSSQRPAADQLSPAEEFVAEQASRTHIFHQRIPIRTAE